MDDTSRQLAHFRHRHSLRYNILLFLCLVLQAPSLVLLVWLDRLHPFMVSLSIGWECLMIAGIIFIIGRKSKIAGCLTGEDMDKAVHLLTQFVEQDHAGWHKSTMFRFILGAGLAGGYLILMLSDLDGRLTTMLPAFFILLLLLSLLRSWLLFLDQLFLQDLIHAHRDHSSGTPE